MSYKKSTSYMNRYFSEKYYYTGKSNTETAIRHVWYNADVIDSAPVDSHTSSFKELVKPGHINWFKVQGLKDSDNITRLAREFGMNFLDIRDVLTPAHVVKVDDEKEYMLLIVNSCSFESHGRTTSEHIAVFVSRNVVITFTETDDLMFENVDNSLIVNVMNIREKQSGMLLAFIVNSIIVELLETASRLEQGLEKLEATLLGNRAKQQHIGSRIQAFRHAYIMLRKNSHPLKGEFNRFFHPKEGVIDDEIADVFEELDEQLEFIIQATHNSELILSSLVDLYVTNNDLKTNAIMKRLTVVSTLFIPITFLVGLWGMNFEFMPELSWKYGYLIAWATILFTVALTWWYMKRKRWF